MKCKILSCISIDSPHSDAPKSLWLMEPFGSEVTLIVWCLVGIIKMWQVIRVEIHFYPEAPAVIENYIIKSNKSATMVIELARIQEHFQGRNRRIHKLHLNAVWFSLENNFNNKDCDFLKRYNGLLLLLKRKKHERWFQ